MLNGISLIFLSILAVPSLLLKRRPDAKEVLDKITPYQEWIGLGFCVWGLLSLISTLFEFRMARAWPILWLTLLAGAFIKAVLGFVLGYSLINRLILSNSEDARHKGAKLMAKLSPVKVSLGIVGIILGIWVILVSLYYIM